MASDPPPSDPRHSADHRGANRISPLRAGIVLIGFLVGATVLVAVGTRAPVSGLPSTAVTTTTAAAAGHSTTTTTRAGGTTTTTMARSATSVQVANGSQGTNLAAHYSAILSAQGWATKPPLDATAQEATSSVYYAAGQQEAAAAIATELEIEPVRRAPADDGGAGHRRQWE